ncbi:hypothetical protein V492_03297 [Pseudogymnoascus sp. VKM F-4246]|nr:hypothetical protein V492_03297 [Pseudogymnoascus sp. VKM F-4246]
MSYSSQPVEADAFIARNLGTRSLGTTYNSTSPGIPEQRTLQKWSSTPTNPPQMSVGVSSTIPYTHTLASYVSNPEDPWSQKGFFAGPSTSDGRLQPNSQPSGQLPVNQNPYGIREGGVILDKPQSDSGYGSLQSAYASSISNFDIGIQATGTRISFPPSHGFQQTEPKVASSGVSISAPPLLHCPTCGKVVKTPSALRKHDQRHKKPFICSYPNCLGSGKGLGFGTINDLERHIKSKHREGEVFGRPVQLFSCHFRECQEKDRKFTRSDNYGVHLQRCHGMKKDMIRGLIQRKKEQHRLGNSRIQPGDRPQGRSYDIQMQDLSQEISYSMEQSNESLVADESHYDMYDHDDQGPGPEDMTFYMATDQSQEYKATHVLEETKYKPAGALDMEYLSGMDPVDTFEPVDFIMDPTLDISESATPVVTTIGITLKRESGADIRASTDPQAQKTLASIFAKRRSQDVKKSRGTSQSSVAPRDISTLLSRIKPISEELNPGDLPADDSKEEDCHTDSQDDDNAATILRDMKSRGYVLRRDKGHFPEPHKPSPPSPSTHSQPGLSCSFCPKTCKRPSEMAATPVHTVAPSHSVPKHLAARTTGGVMRIVNTYTTSPGGAPPYTLPPAQHHPYKPTTTTQLQTAQAHANTYPTTSTHSDRTSHARTKCPTTR